MLTINYFKNHLRKARFIFLKLQFFIRPPARGRYLSTGGNSLKRPPNKDEQYFLAFHRKAKRTVVGDVGQFSTKRSKALKNVKEEKFFMFDQSLHYTGSEHLVGLSLKIHSL